MEVPEEGGGEGGDGYQGGSSNSQQPAVGTIPNKKPVVGDVKLLPSKTLVHLGKQGFAEVCNYTFSVAG